MIFPKKAQFYILFLVVYAISISAPSFAYAESGDEDAMVQFPAFIEFGIPGGLDALLRDETIVPVYRPLTQELKEEVASLKNSKQVKPVQSSVATQAYEAYDLSSYASAPGYSQRIRRIVSRIPSTLSSKDIDTYISRAEPASPVTGEMVVSAASAYEIDVRYIVAIMTAETQLGTDGSKGSRENNFGNVGNSDSAMAAGRSVSFSTPQAGVDRVARWLYQNAKKSTKSRQLAKQSNQGSKIDMNILARF